MKLETYFKSLSPDEQEAYAERSGTTANYIRTHLVAPHHRRKTPRHPLLKRLAKASGGKVSFEEVLEHFYEAEEDAA